MLLQAVIEYFHHAFHEDAKPGDLTGQLGTRSFNSSAQLRMTCNSVALTSSGSTGGLPTNGTVTNEPSGKMS